MLSFSQRRPCLSTRRLVSAAHYAISGPINDQDSALRNRVLRPSDESERILQVAEALTDVLQSTANVSLREILHGVTEVLPRVVQVVVLTALILVVVMVAMDAIVMVVVAIVVVVMMMVTDSGEHR